MSAENQNRATNAHSAVTWAMNNLANARLKSSTHVNGVSSHAFAPPMLLNELYGLSDQIAALPMKIGPPRVAALQDNIIISVGTDPPSRAQGYQAGSGKRKRDNSEGDDSRDGQALLKRHTQLAVDRAIEKAKCRARNMRVDITDSLWRAAEETLLSCLCVRGEGGEIANRGVQVNVAPLGGTSAPAPPLTISVHMSSGVAIRIGALRRALGVGCDGALQTATSGRSGSGGAENGAQIAASPTRARSDRKVLVIDLAISDANGPVAAP